MIYRRKGNRSAAPGGYFILEEEASRRRMHGVGFGEYIQLRDEQGTIWKGSAERGDDDIVRYTLRNDSGHTLTGMAAGYGITLRDRNGRIWKGIVD